MEKDGLSVWWPRIVVILSGGMCATLGLAVIIGWHTHNLSFVQVAPTFPPIYYNTAVGFFLCGAGVLAVASSRLRLAQVSGGLAAALSAVTLSQYLLGVDLGIDQIVVRDTATFTNPYPGRMAPTSALGLALSGAALFLLGRFGYVVSAPKVGLVGLVGVIVTQLGSATLLFYVTGLMTAYGLGRTVSMSFLAALGFTVLGVALIVSARAASRVTHSGALPWLPALVGVGAATVTLLVGQALLVQDQKYIEQQTRATAAAVESKVAAYMDVRILALVRMGKRWEHGDKPSQQEWEFEAGLNIRHFGGYVSIAWVDPMLHTRWVVSREPTATIEDLYQAFAEHRQQAVAHARDQRTVTVTHAVELVQGGKGCLVFVPLFTGEHFDGLISGVFRFRDLFDVIFQDVAPGYALTVFDGKEEIYRRDPAANRKDADWSHETAISPYGVDWRLRVWPTPALVAATQSPLPPMVLGTGLLLALLLALSVSLGQTAQQRAQDTEMTNRELQREMTVRQQAEEALRKAHTELELRVQERTAELATANHGLQVEIRARKRMEQVLATRARELAQSNRELEQFAHVASHDLQEPLFKIVAFGDRLKAKYSQALSVEGRDYVERMQAAATRMQTLIMDLLTLSRITTRPQPFVPVDLSAVAREVISDLEARIKQLSGSVQVDTLPTITADPTQMRQLLQNLIGNALKFHRTGEPPVVVVQGALCQDYEHDLEGKPEDSPHCHVRVADNGIGFEEKYLDRIFNPFERLHERGVYEGTGMGLAICRKIVERHDGVITARSTLGQGTTFVVTLPVQHPTQESE